MFGYRAPEIIGLPFWTLIPPANIEAAEEVYARMLQEHSGQTIEMPHLAKDGSEVDARVTLFMHRDVADRIVGILAVVHDISEEREKRARLAQTTRLAMSDELPGVLGDRMTASTRRLTGEVANGLAGARRVEEVIRDLQSLARAEDERTAPVQMERVMAAALNLIATRLTARAEVVQDLASLPAVEANAGQLCHVFVSLLVNAVEAIEEGAPESNRITLRAWQEDGTVIGEIRDTGSGIPENIQGRVFDPFFSTKERTVGTGLGLAVCQRMVSEIGGHVDFESRVGQGTSFRVRLPALPGKTAGPVEPPTGVDTAASRAVVLVVDDEPMLRTMLVEMLSEHHDVVVAASADEAQALLHRPFDAILCDLTMPLRTGIEFHRWIREHRPELVSRVLFMTGGCFTTEDRDYLDALPTDTLAKPFSEDEVLAALSAVLEARGTT